MEENKELRKELTNAELDKTAGGAIGGQFDGLDMDALIGGPLRAACDAQEQLARATAEFIKQVGMETGGQDGRK